MLRMSSSNPTRNRNELAPMTISDSGVLGTNAAYISSVARNIATPPIIAVGRLCQRSDFGFATNPVWDANSRTAYVKAAARTTLIAPAANGFVKISLMKIRTSIYRLSGFDKAAQY